MAGPTLSSGVPGGRGATIEPFKNLIDATLVSTLAASIGEVLPSFPGATFVEDAASSLPELELKARVVHVADALRRHLPGPFPEDARLLVATLGPPYDPSVKNGADFGVWPLTTFVGRHGLDHPNAALDALHAMTQRFSGEFDVRPYLLHHPDLTLARLEGWTTDPSEHVRRLVSEGTRTRLPWGTRLRPFIDDPEPVLALLEPLREDPSDYVRRSVANNLNDLSKDHPERVIGVVSRWRAEVATEVMDALAAHALRTLVKAGDPAALEVLGYAPDAPVSVDELEVSPRVEIGEHLEVSFVLRNHAEQPAPVVVDLVWRRRLANGTLSPKVLKLRTLTLSPGQHKRLRKRHRMRAVTTRTDHPGQHRVEIQVNGVIKAGAPFELKT